MFRLGLVALLFCAGCGRIGFVGTDGDSISDAGSDGPPGDGSTFSPGYPRLAHLSSSDSQLYDDEGFRMRAAKQAFVIISYYEGWQNQTTMTLEQVVDDIHARSTIGTKIFAYINDFDTLPDPDTDSRLVPLYNKLTAEKWWLYTTGTSGSPVRAYGTNYLGLINYSTSAPLDATGKSYADVNAQYHYDFTITGNAGNAAAPSLDGFYVANLRTKPVADGDWDRDGTTDLADGTVAIDDALRAGSARFATAMHAIDPDILLLVGQFDWDSSPGDLDQAFVGGTRGPLIGQEGSGFENTKGFAPMMADYKRGLAVSAAPKLMLFQQTGWIAGDYQAMRYGLCSTMMDDGYFHIDDGNDSLVDHPLDFDEFDADLGQAIQSPQTAAWQNGVWRRDFERGIALVNPRGNGPQTVDLGGTFHRLSGSQDPVANSGATVTSVTLADRDGLLLLRP